MPSLSKTPFLIGVSGGPCSGKSTVCQRIVDALQPENSTDQTKRVTVIAMENFYKPKTPEQRDMALRGNYNLDHPDAFDEKLLYSTLKKLLNGETVQIARYNPAKYEHTEGVFDTIESVPVLIVEGILVFYFPEIRNLFQMKLFVDTDADTRLARRVLRDMKQHGRSLENILTGYTNHVKPSFEDFCLPTKKYADVIIPRGADNHVAVDLIIQHIRDFFKAKSEKHENQQSIEKTLPARPH
ncbi:unnamed protein product [Adineta ricciae]|uniref:uridine/cytidine kinase n=1 Tax=Adineta ricciae TaxID=249248 RepID=A0A815H9R7_ADIRI|nr:unnamed protein product [Adineta ricciae]CAF1348926.1 unnamed protein product [Adineta ricciae]